MSWLDRLRKRFGKSSLHGQQYRVAFNIYSADGRRNAKGCEFRIGETYLAERDWVRGTTFRDRHSGRLVGPFASPEEAKSFIIATAWFRGVDESSLEKTSKADKEEEL